MFGWLQVIGNWFDARLGIRAVFLPMMRHPVPRALEGGWLVLLFVCVTHRSMIQIITGIGWPRLRPAADTT
jgi:hypothetical protein